MRTDNNKQPYAPPRCEVMEIETTQMIATSGHGNDTEGNHNFGERQANERRGEWGNLWEE